MPKFLLKFNAAVIKEIPLNKDTLTVGRKEDNDIVIDNPAISGHHCKIYQSGDTLIVEDLNSTNGTYINGKKIIKSGVHHNDVIGLVKHTLVFIDERVPDTPPAPPPQNPGEATLLMPTQEMNHITNSSTEAAKTEVVGIVQVLSGIVQEQEYVLTGLSTYIGKSDRVQIPIKGSGLFGGAPEVAAMIARRPEGYYLVAMKEGYPQLNGKPLQGRELLKEGDLIQVGSTQLQFLMKQKK